MHETKPYDPDELRDVLRGALYQPTVDLIVERVREALINVIATDDDAYFVQIKVLLQAITNSNKPTNNESILTMRLSFVRDLLSPALWKYMEWYRQVYEEWVRKREEEDDTRVYTSEELKNLLLSKLDDVFIERSSHALTLNMESFIAAVSELIMDELSGYSVENNNGVLVRKVNIADILKLADKLSHHLELNSHSYIKIIADTTMAYELIKKFGE